MDQDTLITFMDAASHCSKKNHLKKMGRKSKENAIGKSKCKTRYRNTCKKKTIGKAKKTNKKANPKKKELEKAKKKSKLKQLLFFRFFFRKNAKKKTKQMQKQSKKEAEKKQVILCIFRCIFFAFRICMFFAFS